MAGAGSRPARRASGTIVVTGARGFLGAAVLQAFLADGRRCDGWVRNGPLDAALPLRVVGDLASASDDVLCAALADATAIVHFAGRAHIAPSAAADAILERDNVVATVRLARAARAAGVPRFVHISTVKVNGDSTTFGRPFRVDDVPAPLDAYARSKWRGEQALHATLGGGPTRATVVRIPMTYGPGARANFAALVRAVRSGWPLPFASVRNRRHLLGVHNLVAGLAAALDVPTSVVGTYFLADASSVSTPQLVAAIARALGREPRLVRWPPGALRVMARLVGHEGAADRLIGSLEVDTRPFEAAMGWQPAPFRLDAAAVSSVAGESRLAHPA
jgi:nucleoside-diphosphate-sugar epimerase